MLLFKKKGKRNTRSPRLRSLLQFWSAYVPCSSQHLDSVQLALEQIDLIRRLVNKHPESMVLVTTAEGEAFSLFAILLLCNPTRFGQPPFSTCDVDSRHGMFTRGSFVSSPSERGEKRKKKRKRKEKRKEKRGGENEESIVGWQPPRFFFFHAYITRSKVRKRE